MNTKLIIVEGLPGFGKSTTAKLLYDILNENNIDVELYLEGNLDHPADYEGVACLNEDEFESFLVNSGHLGEVFNEQVMKTGNNYLLPYQKIRNENSANIPDSLLNSIAQNDIYELPFEKNVELIAEKWRQFVSEALTGNKTYIFECCLIQNPVTIGMLKYNEQREKVVSYICSLAKITEQLNPILFYVEQKDLEFSFRKAVQERPKEWSSGFVDYYTNQGYGKMKGYQGLDGTIKVLEARRELEREIYDSLHIKKTKINNSNYETVNYKSKLSEKLNVLEILN
ncbi:hypothetical protein [Bacillus suaedae]|uniref:Group-specific protein n=1 Tax=Halalkalibacter suaedae TaxID=2822140 RepID=A0A940WS32_9BACI|nr:hypothetical protein [Bacillus suaedae]MBP3951679.1 hypothetical protein [Bacillus suaedae]